MTVDISGVVKLGEDGADGGTSVFHVKVGNVEEIAKAVNSLQVE